MTVTCCHACVMCSAGLSQSTNPPSFSLTGILPYYITSPFLPAFHLPSGFSIVVVFCSSGILKPRYLPWGQVLTFGISRDNAPDPHP